MKNALIILGLVFVFACHTKEDQAKSGINDPINLIYHDIDSSTIQPSVRLSGPAPVAAPAATPQDTVGVVGGCIDSAKVDKGAMCTQEFKPVCGCDGKTYSNPCKAQKAGLRTWTDGECGGKKPVQGKNQQGKVEQAPAKVAESPAAPANEETKGRKGRRKRNR